MHAWGVVRCALCFLRGTARDALRDLTEQRVFTREFRQAVSSGRACLWREPVSQGAWGRAV